jgi:putative phosphoribosyl transferase
MSAGFRDRFEAGRRLAQELRGYAGRPGLIVLALPRGGVPIGYEVARALGAPLDIFIVRKLGVPGWEELAMGAIASGGVRVLNEEVVRKLPNASLLIEKATERERSEIRRREIEYREGRPVPELQGKTVILVDDGLATGATMRAAILALRKCKITKLIVAVPVGAPETCAGLRDEVDQAICLETPDDFRAVGQFYLDFAQTTDEEVRDLLARAATQGSRV